MLGDDKLRSVLDQINWDFDGALSSYGLHRLHWYPGTFIPQIPAYLIELFSEAGGTVYDPFCGVGTTVVEAIRLGRRGIGVDVNPLAVRIAKAKVSFFTPARLHVLQKRFEDRLADRCDQYAIGRDFVLFRRSRKVTSPREEAEWSVLRPWYHEATWREMLTLREVIDEYRGRFRKLLDVVFSSIVKRTCSQREHWGYVADNMQPRHSVYINAITTFEKALADAIDSLSRFLQFPDVKSLGIRELNRRARLICCDLLETTPVEDEKVDLVVTSPPYPNVTDYTRSQRLSYWWFKQSVDDLREQEVGARFKRTRSGAYHDYFTQMRVALMGISKSLKVGGHLCLVLGESEKQRQNVGVVSELRGFVLGLGYDEPFSVIRRQLSRQRLLRRDGRSGDESILIFRKR